MYLALRYVRKETLFYNYWNIAYLTLTSITLGGYKYYSHFADG